VFLSGQPWDTHSQNASRLRGLCDMTDQPSAALVLDLKRRGLLDSTIVLWTGEFGRLPISQAPDGRDPNRHAFSPSLAGGGTKRVHAANRKGNPDFPGRRGGGGRGRRPGQAGHAGGAVPGAGQGIPGGGKRLLLESDGRRRTNGAPGAHGQALTALPGAGREA